MGRLSLALLLSALAVAPACAPGRSPDLLEVADVSPHSLERGTHLELDGVGFPDRRIADVAFVGKLYRPGESPRSVNVRTSARADSRSHLSLNVGADLLRQFLDGAPHGTFRGSVIVGFGARTSDAPALGGRLDGVVLDLFGDAAERRGKEPSLAERGKAFSSFLGIRLNESFEIVEVTPQREGERAGLALGDRVVALDGVRVDTESDLAPRPDGRESEITVRRSGLGELPRSLDRTGFRAPGVGDLAPGIGLVAAVVVLMLLLLGRGARAWALFEARLVERLERATQALRRDASVFSRASSARRAESLPLRVSPYLGFFTVSLALSALSLGHPLFGADADLPIWLSSAGAACAIAAFLGGSRRSGSTRKGFALGSALAAAGQALLVFLPVLLAMVSAVYESGSLRLFDLVSTQGALPERWRAFESPWSLALFLLLLAALVPENGVEERAWAGAGEALDGAVPARGMAPLTVEVLEWLGLVTSCALGAVVFLGGWSVPGFVELPLLGAGLLLTKTWVLLCLVAFARQVLRARRAEIWAPWTRVCLSLALCGLSLQIAAVSLGLVHAHAPALGLSARALAACIGGYCALRVAYLARRRLPTLAINPWL